ncbi:MAG: hypothetical protein JXA89_18440 [Anaerolineae bacterium]|nr:hypothetical protein [Anaerolineae bacterium]
MNLKRLFHIILTVIALSTGIIVLLSFVINSANLRAWRGVLVEWTVIVVAFALFIGVLNVLNVHAQRVLKGQSVIYSLILVGAFSIVFVSGILPKDLLPSNFPQFTGPDGLVMDFVFRYIQRPVQATLFSLMAFFIVTAAWRAFRIHSAASLVMFISAILVLLGSIYLDLGGAWQTVVDIKDWVLRVPAMAGARGILLGIVLGTVVTGMRLLLGIEKPYTDQD